MSYKDINYDTYYGKHCARYYGWLPASKMYRKQIGGKSINYFTLCAKAAIDIFMLESEGILLRDDNKKLPNVIICEAIEKDASEIFKLVRPPLKEAILVGKLEEILTFQDTEQTRNLSPDDEVKSYEIRKMLKIKELSERVKKYFPFDIINFDPYESLVDQNLGNNRLYDALTEILELQCKAVSFLLFITTNISKVHPDVESRFETDVNNNVSKYPKIKETLSKITRATLYNEISDVNKKSALGFAKSLVISMSREKGWKCQHQGIYIYEYKKSDGSKIKMLNLVVKLSKTKSKSERDSCLDDILNMIKRMPRFFSHEAAESDEQVKRHLKKIVAYREEIRKEFSEDL